MPWESKYKPKYAKLLENGLRSNGMTVVEVCLMWKIDQRTYKSWREKYPRFDRAAELGDMQAAAWWSERYRMAATGLEPGNAALLQFAAKNIEKIEWKDKTEVHNTHDEQIHTLVIKTLPSYDKPRILEHESGTGNLLDQKPE